MDKKIGVKDPFDVPISDRPIVKSLYASRIAREMAPARVLSTDRYHSIVAATDGTRLAVVLLLHDPNIRIRINRE